MKPSDNNDWQIVIYLILGLTNNKDDDLSPEAINTSEDYSSDDNRDILTRLVKDVEEKGKKGTKTFNWLLVTIAGILNWLIQCLSMWCILFIDRPKKQRRWRRRRFKKQCNNPVGDKSCKLYLKICIKSKWMKLNCKKLCRYCNKWVLLICF